MDQNNFNKPRYKVGEVSQMIGVESYILRYWEKMFPQLNPLKDESGQRIYTESDIDVVKRIKSLLYEERYTIDGARKRLKGKNSKSDKTYTSYSIKEIQEVLEGVHNILKEISVLLEKG